MKIFNNIDWVRTIMNLQNVAPGIAFCLIILLLMPFWEYSGYHEPDINQRIYDYGFNLVISVTGLWAFISGSISKLNVSKFKVLVEALEALPEDIRSNEVDMSSTDEPTCGAVGCFTGLISIVADDIPELKEIYLFSSYNCYNWKDTLYDFLECDFSKWAEHKPKIWGNAYGWHMFESAMAFGKDHGYILSHDEIIIHLRDVCNRLEQSNTVKPA